MKLTNELQWRMCVDKYNYILSLLYSQKMAEIIQGLINGFKDMFKEIEKMTRTIVSEIGTAAQNEGRKAEVLTEKALRDIKNTLNSKVRAFKSKVSAISKEHFASGTGTAESFKTRIENALRLAQKDIERILGVFREAAKDFIKSSRDIIAKISAETEKVVDDTFEDLKTTGDKLLVDVKTIGENAFKEIDTFTGRFVKHLELDAKFNFSHDIQVAEAAVLVALPVIVPIGLGLCIAAITAASHYEPG